MTLNDNTSQISHFYQLINFINDFCVKRKNADAWRLWESLTGSGSAFNMFLVINAKALIFFALI